MIVKKKLGTEDIHWVDFRAYTEVQEIPENMVIWLENINKDEEIWQAGTKKKIFFNLEKIC